MCRHLAYLGPPRTLHSLMYEGSRSLEHQSYAPRMGRGRNVVNADGFGIGWYPRPGEAVRFRRAQPIWSDASFREISGAVTASCAVAAIRSATVGFPVDESCAQPFRHQAWLFSHNGRVDGFAGLEAKLRELAGDLSGVPDARAPVDSALLFGLSVTRWRAGRTLAEGLADVATTLAALAPGRYNLLAADGAALAATAWGDSLFVRTTGDETWIASEPLDDDGGWHEVPDRSLVTAPDLVITPL